MGALAATSESSIWHWALYPPSEIRLDCLVLWISINLCGRVRWVDDWTRLWWETWKRKPVNSYALLKKWRSIQESRWHESLSALQSAADAEWLPQIARWEVRWNFLEPWLSQIADWKWNETIMSRDCHKLRCKSRCSRKAGAFFVMVTKGEVGISLLWLRGERLDTSLLLLGITSRPHTSH